jgi:hypothetical protein
MDAPGAEAVLGDEEAGAGLPQQGLGAEVDVLVEDLGVVAELAEGLGGVLHRRHVADDRHARGVDRHDEHRGALVGPGVGLGDRHDDEEIGDRGVRGEPLVAVEDPAVAVALGMRAQLGRVRARALGLGHREGRLEVARQQRVQPALLLLVGAGQREDLGVARIGRLVAERVGREGRRAEDLVHEAELDLAEALPAEVGRQMRRPQPAALDLVLQRRVDAVERRLVEVRDDRLDGPDLLAHEGAHPLQLLFELGLGREVPRHGFRRPQGSRSGAHRTSPGALERPRRRALVCAPAGGRELLTEGSARRCGLSCRGRGGPARRDALHPSRLTAARRPTRPDS